MINNVEPGTIVNWVADKVGLGSYVNAPDIDDFFFKHYRREWKDPNGKITLSSVAVNEPIKIKITGDLASIYYNFYLKYNRKFEMAFQWQRGQYQGDPSGEWENIWGATSNTYTPTPDDHGYHIRLKVVAETGYKPLYSSACYVNAPHITGSAEIPSEVRCGQEITVKLTGDLGKVPTDRISFVWERKGDDDDYWHRYIATGNKYTPTQEDVGKKIRVYVDPYDYTTFLDSNEASVLPALKRRNPRLGGSTRPVRKTSRSKV
ncbi:MAG TPA: hypothetical protein P5191_06720 [Ruminococcus sp.]|nr:hypothetical protein [Ruminococcus sp.]